LDLEGRRSLYAAENCINEEMDDEGVGLKHIFIFILFLNVNSGVI
jgi:hypothetical protein